jgi:transposase
MDVTMRQVYRGGEKLFVDFAGDTVPVFDPKTGEVRLAQIFVAVLGASGYTFATAFWAQDLPCWIEGHILAFEFFAGVPEIVVPDNLKAGVTKASYYEPEVNPTYQELAEHYGTVIIPARPRKSTDKAKVERGVLLVEQQILARLRNHSFFNLHELRQGIQELLPEINERPFQKLDGSRRSLYEELDKPALKPLPPTRYTFAEWRKAKVNIDYHIEVDYAFYSVPYQLVGVREPLDVRLTAHTVEVFRKGKRVASHTRLSRKGGYSTQREHMPAAHRAHAEWTPSRVVNWGRKVGDSTGKLVTAILASKPHPEQGYRACLGLIRLERRYGGERLEAACARALSCQAFSYRSVKSILDTGLDRVPVEESHAELPPHHENVRGLEYYADQEGDLC